MLQHSMSASQKPVSLRRLVIVLGDQLDRESTLLKGLDAEQDMIFMAEVREEATHVWSHKARIALFLIAAAFPLYLLISLPDADALHRAIELHQRPGQDASP